jgi:hypothetical protein
VGVGPRRGDGGNSSSFRTTVAHGGRHVAGEALAAGVPTTCSVRASSKAVPGIRGHPDGQRFLNVTSSDEAVEPITPIQNWAAAIKR